MRPTREGRVSPNRAGLVFKGIGVDPGTVTTDPPDPTDRAPDGTAFIPTLPPPTPGEPQDLNLAFGTDYDGGGIRPVVNPTFANDGDLTTWAERISYYNGSGTDTWWLEADLGTAYDVEQIVIRGGSTNPSQRDPAWEIQHSPDSVTWTTAVGTYVFNSATSPMTATLTLTSTQTKRYWRVGDSVGVGFIYAVKIFTLQINGETPGDPSNPIWIEAPVTVDDDSGTFEWVSEDTIDVTVGPFWRGDLGDTYLIGSMAAQIGFDDAGAATVLVQGGNASDYSDQATIDSVAITATGSFTLDDLAASWTPTDVYRYWQLVLSSASQAVYVYEVELFDATTGQVVGIITDHDDLTGLTDDDHKQYTLINEGGQDLVQAHGTLGATETIDPTLGNVHTGTLDANCTITLSAPPGTRDGDPSAALIQVRLTEDGTGGWTPTFAASGGSIAWVGGTTPTHTTTLNTLTVYLFETVDGGTTWLGMQIGGGSSLTVKDEGTPLATAATSLDFVGAGVVASGATAAKTITVSGAPTGAAGGDLSGTYPNPDVVNDSHSHTAATIPDTVTGPILITDTPAGSPLVFADLLQNEAGDDLLYADV